MGSFHAIWNIADDFCGQYNEPIFPGADKDNDFEYIWDLLYDCTALHCLVAFHYFNRNLSLHELKGLMDEVIIIETPQVLFEQRLITKESIPQRRVLLREFQRNFRCSSTIFQDPGFFYYYITLGLIFSPVPVTCHKIIPNAFPSNMGKRWAIFEEKGSGSEDTPQNFTFSKVLLTPTNRPQGLMMD